MEPPDQQRHHLRGCLGIQTLEVLRLQLSEIDHGPIMSAPRGRRHPEMQCQLIRPCACATAATDAPEAAHSAGICSFSSSLCRRRGVGLESIGVQLLGGQFNFAGSTRWAPCRAGSFSG